MKNKVHKLFSMQYKRPICTNCKTNFQEKKQLKRNPSWEIPNTPRLGVESFIISTVLFWVLIFFQFISSVGPNPWAQVPMVNPALFTSNHMLCSTECILYTKITVIQHKIQYRKVELVKCYCSAFHMQNNQVMTNKFKKRTETLISTLNYKITKTFKPGLQILVIN